MLTCLGVAEAFGQSEIDDIHVMLFLANANQKVIRLNVSVKEVARVHEFDSLKHLISEHEHSLEGELALAVVKQIFERGT